MTKRTPPFSPEVRAARDFAPPPPRSALERSDAGRALMARQTFEIACNGGRSGMVR